MHINEEYFFESEAVDKSSSVVYQRKQINLLRKRSRVPE